MFSTLFSRHRSIIPAILTALFLLAASSRAEAQGGATVSGFVVDSASKERMVGATVRVRNTKLGAITNKSGFFSIPDIPPGSVTITVNYVAYEPTEQTFTLGPGESKRVEVEIRERSASTTVSVTATRTDDKKQIEISRIDVPVEQLKQLRIGGESDVFRSLQYLPGVLTSSQISSGLYIRGGSPDQNLVLIDGSTVYNPSHLFGFFSTFNTEAIKDVELIKGGYPAEYGGRLSAVLNLTQKDGNREKVEGVVSLGLISSRATLEGPIGNGSWMLSGRRTYLDLLLGLLPEDPDNPLPDFNFYDLNGKITQDFGPNDRVSLSGFASGDQLDFEGQGVAFGLGIGNQTGAARWTHIFGDNLFTSLNLSASHYYSGFDANQTGFEVGINNSITDISAKASAEWYATENLTVKAGLETTHYIFDFDRNFTGDSDTTAQNGTLNGAQSKLRVEDWLHSVYGQANLGITEDLNLQLGGRAMYAGLRGEVAFDPRVALRWQLGEGVALKGAWGLYHQYLHLATLPDFSFFDTWLPTDTTVPYGSSAQYILSLETEPIEGYNLNVEAYYKRLNDITEFNQFQTNAQNVREVFFLGNADAYGVELFIQKKVGDFTGWAGYALGFIDAKFDSINNGRTFRPKYDRRHDVKVVAQYKLSEHWDIGASFNFQSGQSYTGVTSRFSSALPGEENTTSVSVPADRYALRLPASHQLNINANYNTTLFDLPFRVMLDVYNVYSRRDIWFRYFDVTKSVVEVVDVRLLPILPTVAVELRF